MVIIPILNVDQTIQQHCHDCCKPKIKNFWENFKKLTTYPLSTKDARAIRALWTLAILRYFNVNRNVGGGYTNTNNLKNSFCFWKNKTNRRIKLHIRQRHTSKANASACNKYTANKRLPIWRLTLLKEIKIKKSGFKIKLFNSHIQLIIYQKIWLDAYD